MIHRRQIVRAWRKMRDAFLYAGLTREDAVRAVEEAEQTIEVLPDEDPTAAGIRHMFRCGQEILEKHGITCAWTSIGWISMFFITGRGGMRNLDRPATKTVALSPAEMKALEKYGWFISEEFRSADLGSDEYNPDGLFRNVLLPLAGFRGPRYLVRRTDGGYSVTGRVLTVVGLPEDIRSQLVDIRAKLGENKAKFIRR